MKKLLLASVAAALLVSCGTGQAATLGPDAATEGLSYQFSLIGGALNTTTATFNVHITGINGVPDTRDGRSGINAFAIRTDGLPSISSGSTTLAGAPFQSGGLNSSGCNGSGGFFCFGNTLVADTPALPANTVIDIAFTLNLVSGNFLTWSPDWKIDWNGAENNYSLVSEVIPLGPNGTPFDFPPEATPIPGALWLFGGGLGILAMFGKRRKRVTHLAWPKYAEGATS